MTVTEEAPSTDEAPGSRCCELHKPGEALYAVDLADGPQVVGECCDDRDCGPCCPECPTCPTLQRIEVSDAQG